MLPLVRSSRDNRGMKQPASKAKARSLGPHSRVLVRGAVGEIDGRSREGRFLRQAESELVAQVGGEPSFGQRVLIRRAAKGLLQLELFDVRLADGNLTGHDTRAFSALSNQVRLALRDLGLKTPTKAKAPALADILAEHARKASPA